VPREHDMLRIMEAACRMQEHVAGILEVKALEMEKSRNWICRHVLEHHYAQHDEQLKQALAFHGQMVELIDGITKVEESLARNAKTVLRHNEDSGSLGLGGMGGLFGGDNEGWSKTES
jgi:hypothetical protein